ncbi:hypothetical protein MHYP_G00239040 [Metynnis hypsauchen]
MLPPFSQSPASCDRLTNPRTGGGAFVGIRVETREAASQTHLTSESTLSARGRRELALTRRSCHRPRTEGTRAEPQSAPVHRGRDL